MFEYTSRLNAVFSRCTCCFIPFERTIDKGCTICCTSGPNLSANTFEHSYYDDQFQQDTKNNQIRLNFSQPQPTFFEQWFCRGNDWIRWKNLCWLSLVIQVFQTWFSRCSMLAQGECAEAKRQGEGQKESTREEGEPGLMWVLSRWTTLVDGQLEEMYQAILEGKGRDHFPSAIGLCYFFWRKDLDLTCLHLGIHDMCIG